jgi:hypothetical protein
MDINHKLLSKALKKKKKDGGTQRKIIYFSFPRIQIKTKYPKLIFSVI